jgi:integrase
MKKSFVSKLAPIIKEYLKHREMLGYTTNRHESYLAMFDVFCHKHYPDLETLTKESVRNWMSCETSCGHNGMYARATSIRMLALYMGGGAYVLPSEYFFVRSNNTPMPNERLANILKKCWQRANPGVPRDMLPRLRPYDMRHRFATAVLQKWIDEERDLYAMLPYLSAYMGHFNFTSTAYYIHLLPENLLNSAAVDWGLIDDTTPEVNIWIN